jgi:DNA-binding transcriptional LysR family regulator
VEGWQGVELRHLAALAAVHEEQSFRGAAERLGYVQSAVSQQIAQLERLVGIRLVERARGHAPPLKLTDAGALLLEHGAQILAQLDAAHADLRALADGTSQTIRLGVIQSVATTLLPAALVDLRANGVDLAVEVTEAPSDRDLFARVERGELDAAFAELPLLDGPFEGEEVLIDPCVLVVPADSERAAAGPPQCPRQLAELPLIRIQGWPMLELVEAHLRAVGVEPRFALSADANATVQALVAAGVGAAIMPRLAVAGDDCRVVALSVGELLPPRRLALYWHRDRLRTEALEAFHAATIRAGAAFADAEADPVHDG